MALPKIISGKFTFPDNTPAANAVLTLVLSQDGGVGSSQIAHVPLTVQLDATGSIPANTGIFANDQISPNGTYYIVSIKDSVYGLVYFEKLAIQGVSPIDLNQLVPNSKNASAPANVQGLVRVRSQHTVTAPEVTAGFTDIVITWPTAYADTNYTPQFSVLSISGIATNSRPLAMLTKTATTITCRVNCVTAGDVFEVNASSVHD